MKEINYQVEMIDVLHDEKTLISGLKELRGVISVNVDLPHQEIRIFMMKRFVRLIRSKKDCTICNMISPCADDRRKRDPHCFLVERAIASCYTIRNQR